MTNTIRSRIANGITPFIGVYDAFSASLAAEHYDSLFVSGFGFAASHYGLPDLGFVAWPDIVAFVHRIRMTLPQHEILVDIDDGYCDTEVACHVVAELESVGASAVVLEDQQRPRRCGHFEGKQLMAVDDYVDKLKRVLSTRRRDLFVVARTDASLPDDVFRRVEAFTAAGADAILVDAISSFEMIREVRKRTHLPLAFNQIAGGKSPRCGLHELAELGVSFVIYSTPCLFAAQAAIHESLIALKASGGTLPSHGVDVKTCTAVLHTNLARRDSVADVRAHRSVATRAPDRDVADGR